MRFFPSANELHYNTRTKKGSRVGSFDAPEYDREDFTLELLKTFPVIKDSREEVVRSAFAWEEISNEFTPTWTAVKE